MQIIIPTVVNDGVLVSSTAPTTGDPAAWAAGTAYSAGARATVAHTIYEAVQATTGDNPATDDGTNWFEIGATNVWRAFDNKISAKVTATGSMEYVLIDPARAVTGVALFGLVGTTARVQVDDPIDGVVFDETVDLIDNGEVVDWRTYFYAPIAQLSEAFLLNIPPYVGATVTVTIEGNGGIELGQLVIGDHQTLAASNFGTTLTIEDYSRKERDTFGNPIIVQRAFAQIVDYDVTFETGAARSLLKTLASLRTTPAVWIGTEDRALGTIVLGYYRRFDLVLSSPTISQGSIEVEGLI